MLEKALESQGYILVRFNHISNSAEVETLLRALRLKEYSKGINAFTYVDENRRIVFILEDLSEDEECVLLAHEQGHISFGHLMQNGCYGASIINEWEANEFSHYLLKNKQSSLGLSIGKSNGFMRKKALLAAAAALIVICLIGIIGLFVTFNNSNNKEMYIVTLTGTKYHRKDCSFIKNSASLREDTVENLKKEGYEACSICLKEQ